MRQYELIVIMRPDIAEDDVPDAVDRLVRRSVEARGGEVQDVNHWGRRKLAYPIKKQLEGNYVMSQLRLDPLKTRDLEQGLMLAEEVLRHLLVRVGD